MGRGHQRNVSFPYSVETKSLPDVIFPICTTDCSPRVFRYEDNLTDTMYQYATHPSQPVDELEVFLGSIIGKNWNLSKRQRELSKEMKEKYERDVAFTIDCILRGGDGASRVIEHDALEKTMACLSLGVEVEAQMSRKTGKGRGRGKGKAAWRSFGWVAAALCLRELEKFQSGRVGPALFT